MATGAPGRGRAPGALRAGPTAGLRAARGRVLGADGQPVSRWWPVAYALQRVGDARAAPALLALLSTPGRYTASFAVRGLANAEGSGGGAIRDFVEQPRDAALMIQAIRALVLVGDSASLPLLTRIVGDPRTDPAIRTEAMTALATLADAPTSDVLVELVSDPSPAVRGAAMRALARVNPETFTATLSGLDAEANWTVRAAQAAAFGSLADGRAFARLSMMPDDADVRVVPAVLAAVAASKAPGAAALLRAKLRAPGGARCGGTGAGTAQGRGRRAGPSRRPHRRRGRCCLHGACVDSGGAGAARRRRVQAAARRGPEGQGLGGARAGRRPAA